METHEPYWSPGWQEIVRQPTGMIFSTAQLSDFVDDRGMGEKFLVDFLALLPAGCWAAGGCCGNLMGERQDIKDIDVFFDSPEAFDAMETLLRTHEFFAGYFTPDIPEPSRVHNWDRADSPRIQLIKTMWYASAEAVLDSFDFTISQVAADATTVWFNPLAPLDLARKRLVVHRVLWAASTLGRLAKYAKRGFYACPGSLQRLSDAIRLSESTGDEYVYID